MEVRIVKRYGSSSDYMSLNNALELANTRAKLARLEARYEALRNDLDSNRRVRELSMSSLNRLINQFKEEIARYEAHQAVRR
jgi:hypothetical protein